MAISSRSTGPSRAQERPGRSACSRRSSATVGQVPEPLPAPDTLTEDEREPKASIPVNGRVATPARQATTSPHASGEPIMTTMLAARLHASAAIVTSASLVVCDGLVWVDSTFYSGSIFLVGGGL